MNKMNKRLFISHASADSAVAKKISDELSEEGYDVWMARQDKDIRGAVDWTQSIQNAIDSSDGLILVWSKSAAESVHVREEIRIARVFLMPIFPLRANPSEEVPSLPDEIGSLQVIKMGSLASNIKELTCAGD